MKSRVMGDVGEGDFRSGHKIGSTFDQHQHLHVMCILLRC